VSGFGCQEGGLLNPKMKLRMSFRLTETANPPETALKPEHLTPSFHYNMSLKKTR
jgi:hypothetical protein